MCAVFLVVVVLGETMSFPIRPNYYCGVGGTMVSEGYPIEPVKFQDCSYVNKDGYEVYVTQEMINNYRSTGNIEELCENDLLQSY